MCDGCFDLVADRNYERQSIGCCVLKWESNYWGRDLRDTTFITVTRPEYDLSVYAVSRFVPSVIINEMLFGFDTLHRVITLPLFLKHFCEVHNLYSSPFLGSEGSGGWHMEWEVYMKTFERSHWNSGGRWKFTGTY